MTRLILVRHGQAAAGWGEDHDPGLDEVGRAQAEAMADALGPLGPLPIVVSPLRRTRETAAALESRWGVTATVDPRVGEIVSPVDELEERQRWLREVMRGAWAELGADLARWRDTVVDGLRSITEDSVVVTHFVAINVAVGHALGDDRVVCVVPDNCSRTLLDVGPDGFRVVEVGEQVTETLVQ